MRTIQSRISGKGHVTIPKAVCSWLGLETPGPVEWLLEDDGSVRLRKPLTLADLFGSVPEIPGASDDLRAEIESAMAEGIARQIREGRVF